MLNKHVLNRRKLIKYFYVIYLQGTLSIIVQLLDIK